MPLLFWDASALVKRYFLELGSDTDDELFAAALPEMATTPRGYAETYSVLLRRLNGGVLDPPSFTAAVTALQAEVVDSPTFGLMSITDEAVFASVLPMRQHNLNATDAAVLTTFMAFVQSSPPAANPSVLIAADQRLLRAGIAEGLMTVNPEVMAANDVGAFLANL